jgi:hypothetical protein
LRMRRWARRLVMLWANPWEGVRALGAASGGG